MKKNIFLVAALFVASMVAFVGCGKDDDKGSGSTGLSSLTISGTLEDDLSDVVKVTVFAGKEEDIFLAEGSVSGDKFSVTLDTPPASALTPISENAEDLLNVKEITISNPNAKGTGVSIVGYDINDWEYYMSKSKQSSSLTNMTMANEGYIYVDSNVSIAGNTTVKEEVEGVPISMKVTVNMQLKKGWNIIVMTMSINQDGMSIDVRTGSLSGGTWSSSSFF